MVIWTDADTTGLWSDPGNWSTGVVPTAANVAVFDDTQPGGSDANATVDTATSVGGLNIDHYTGTVTLGFPLTIGSNGLSQAGGTITGGASLTVNNGSVSVSGGILDVGALHATGATTLAGAISTSSTQAYDGPVTVAADTNLTGATVILGSSADDAAASTHGLTVTGSAVFDGPVGAAAALRSLHVTGATTLAGGAVSTSSTQAYDGPVTVAADTNLTATTASFGSDVHLNVHRLNVVGNVAFSPSTTLAVAANGASSGDYGQVTASGALSLAGAGLDLSVSYSAAPGDTLSIVTDSSGAVSGTFAGLAEGSTVAVNGIQWRVHYGSSAVTLTALQLPQTVTFTSSPPSPAVYGGSYTPAAAGGGSGNPVVFSIDASSVGCSLAGNTVTFTGIGTCVLDANQAGNSSYSAAPQVQQTFSIVRAALTVTASSPSMTYGHTPPAITPIYSGFVNGDQASSLTTQPACSTTATAASAVGSYPSTCQGAANNDYTFTYHPGTVTVTPAATTISYTASQAVTAGTSLAPAAALTSAAAACQSGQQVSFSLSQNPLNGAVGPYSLGSATTTSTGQATGALVSTASWKFGAYTITASFAGTANCAGSSQAVSFTVTVPGEAAAGAGKYTLANAGAVSFALAALADRHAPGGYIGQVAVVNTGRWWFQAAVSSYVKSSSTRGIITGSGALYWWNPALRHGGGWQLASSGVAYTATFTATTKTSPGSFGIQIAYSPAPPQPAPLPNSAPINLTSGAITVS